MALFARTLWPGPGRVPYLRLILALIIAPAILSAVLAAASFGIYGMTASSREVVIYGTREAAIALTILMFMFTPTFGLIGVLALWSAAKRSVLAWFATGAAMGANAGALFSYLFMRPKGPAAATPIVDVELVGAGAVVGAVLFLLIRWIAGVQADPKVSA